MLLYLIEPKSDERLGEVNEIELRHRHSNKMMRKDKGQEHKEAAVWKSMWKRLQETEDIFRNENKI